MTSKKTIELFEPKPIKIKKFKRLKFRYSDEYQRTEVWKTNQKQSLIDSILHNYPIGTPVLKKLKKDIFEVIDGQQRLKTIQEFTGKRCKWRTSKYSKIFPNKSYHDVKKDDLLGPKFDDYTIWYIPMPEEIVDDEQICDIFIRLQEGTPTNVAEKLNAMKGKIRKLIFELRNQSFFKKTLIKNYRFNYRLLLAHICLIEIEFLNKETFLEFPNLRFPNLRKMYNNYREEELPLKLESNINKTFNFLLESFRNSAKFIENNGDFLQVYLLAAILTRKYSITSNIKRIFRDFFRDFLIKTINIQKEIKNLTEAEIERDPIKLYASLRSKGQTKENLRRKFTVITNEFFEKVKVIEPLIIKDQKRDFELCQKLYVYYKKNKEICQKCKKYVSWKDSSFHHKFFHSKGGPTTIKNCQLMCKKCHIDLHKKEKDISEIHPY